jgi:hypothetical protein
MLVTQDIWEAEVGGSFFKASLGKSARRYLKNKLKAKDLGSGSSDRALP